MKWWVQFMAPDGLDTEEFDTPEEAAASIVVWIGSDFLLEISDGDPYLIDSDERIRRVTIGGPTDVPDPFLLVSHLARYHDVLGELEVA